jgi:hypothetical protein
MLWFWLATLLGVVIAVVNLIRQKFTLLTIAIFVLTITGLVVQGIKYYEDNIGKEVLIGTQTANGKEAIQWTGLGRYDTLRLQCNNLTPSTKGVAFRLLYAEGNIPTWQAAQYQSHSTTREGEITNTGELQFGILIAEVVEDITTFTANISDVSSRSAYKMTVGTGATTSATKTLTFSFSGMYRGNKDPLTGIMVLPSMLGFISGTCSLYGRFLPI